MVKEMLGHRVDYSKNFNVNSHPILKLQINPQFSNREFEHLHLERVQAHRGSSEPHSVEEAEEFAL